MIALWQDYKAAWIVAGVAVVGAMLSIIVVPEDQQAVVIQAGKPVRVYNRFSDGAGFGQNDAGLHFRIPLVEQVQRVDKRLLSVEIDQQQVLSSDQQELSVDAYARYRIIDPVRMVRSAGTLERLETQLEPILASALRQELGKHTFQALLTPEQGLAMQNIRATLDRQAREYGAQVTDVRIKRSDLPDGTLDAAVTRMEAAREERAKTIAAQGQRDAQIIRADADAQSAKVLADSFDKDPEFYDFYRAMQSYQISFAKDQGGGKTIVLSPENSYLNRFREP